MRFGIHCSHEQYSPSELLSIARVANKFGFESAMCSDHFSPWLPEQGNSGFAWSWLGAALEATSMSFGTVCAPGQRYHPAIVAQAAATLSQMYPDRFWLAVGSGELLNEHITSDPWPEKQLRNKRLRESAEIMKALWRGETVTSRGLIKTDRAKLEVRPNNPPLLFGAALTESTAEFVGQWADGLITVAAVPEKLSKIIEAFRKHAGTKKPIYLQVGLSYAPTEEVARDNAFREWRQACLDAKQLAELATPDEFAEATKGLDKESIYQSLRVSSDLEKHRQWLAADLEFGIEKIFLHNVGRNNQQFMEDFATKVIPCLG